jgi:hypothetical protein
MLKDEFNIDHPGIYFSEKSFSITIDDSENSENRNYVSVGDYLVKEESSNDVRDIYGYEEDAFFDLYEEI